MIKLKEDLEKARTQGNLSAEGDILVKLGDIYLNHHELGKALTSFEKVLKIRREVGDLKKLATTLHSIGAICLGLSRWDDVIRYSKEAHDLYHEMGSKLQEVGCLTNIATAYRGMNDLSGAVGTGKKALELADKEGFQPCNTIWI